MIGIYVPDIGDGLSCGIETNSGNSLQVDCGSQQDASGAFYRGMLKIHPDYLILSHFHADHYNGLFEGLRAKVGFQIREVLFPRVPQFSKRGEFIRCMMAMNFRVLGGGTGSMEYDFLSLIRQLNNRPFNYTSVSQGDHVVVDGTHLDVLWPPKVLCDEEMLDSVGRAIEDFDSAKENDKTLGRIYEQLGESGVLSPYLDESEGETAMGSAEREHAGNYRGEQGALPEMTEKANRSLRAVANRLSLAFHSDSLLLFMGDLEANEINQVVKQLEIKSRMSFQVMLTPHHGTHWGKQLTNLSANVAISSVGDRLIKHIEPGYKTIVRRHLVTFLVGDVYLPEIAWLRRAPWFSPYL